MAPPRKKRRLTPERPGREYKVRLPEDVAQRVEAKAKAQGWPQNRIIINELAAFPDLEQFRNIAERVREMEVLLARYGARVTWHDLSEELLNAVDAVLAAQGGALQAALDRLRVVRTGMLLHAKRK
jgi:hypothetical protein